MPLPHLHLMKGEIRTVHFWHTADFRRHISSWLVVGLHFSGRACAESFKFNPWQLQGGLEKTPAWNSGELLPVNVDRLTTGARWMNSLTQYKAASYDHLQHVHLAVEKYGSDESHNKTPHKEQSSWLLSRSRTFCSERSTTIVKQCPNPGKDSSEKCHPWHGDVFVDISIGYPLQHGGFC